MHEVRTKLQEQYAQIEAEFSCRHETRELRRRVVKNGAVAYVRQCVQCGNTSSAVKAEIALAEAGGNAIPDFDASAETQWRDQKSARYRQAADSLSGERSAEYSEYLLSPEWEAKRNLVFKRSRDTCEGCGERPADEVHHLSYAHAGNEFLWELVAICTSCHERVHKDDDAIR